MDKQTFADITAEQIQDWKAKHGENSIHQATITTDCGEYNFIIRVPGRSVCQAVAKANSNAELQNKLLITNCLLGGDDYIFEQDGAVYLAVLDQIGLLHAKAEGSVKKL